MLRVGVIMKNTAKGELNFVYNNDVGHDVCHADFGVCSGCLFA